MTEEQSRQARMRTEARDAALAAKRVERISNLGIGRADSQRVSTETARTAVAELERDIDRVQHRLENQARTIKVQAETIARFQEQIESVSDTAWSMATQYHLDWAEKTLHLIAARCGAMYKYDALRLVLETVKEAHVEIAKRREVLPTQNPPICPVEPPVPTEAANVPREAVGVHPAPNVTIAERLGK